MWPLLTTYTNRQGLVIETVTLTGSAGQLIHVEAHLGASVIAISFMVTTLDIIDNSFKRNVNIAYTTKFIFIVKMEFLAI